MCILAWHWQPGAPTELLLLANRDEAYDRAAAPLQQWKGAEVLAGRDLKAGGTWMGAGRRRRFAALTNHRTGAPPDPDAPSRGMLVHDFLVEDSSARDYLDRLAPQSTRYNPFNLLVWDGVELLGLEGRHGRIVTLQQGWGGVSNADFHTPWPKLQRLQAGLRTLLPTAPQDRALLELLADTTPAPEHLLPSTGVGPEIERALSSIFIHTPGYGTRASTVVRVGPQGVSMTEQTYHQGRPGQAVHLHLPFHPF
jgi:uncharacterized protein with NRDE domain